MSALSSRMLRRLVAILTGGPIRLPASPRSSTATPSSWPGSSLQGIDAPELDQTFWWRGQHMAYGAMSLAALEALIAGVKVRCEVVERDRHGRLVAKVCSPNKVDIGRRLVSAGRWYAFVPLKDSKPPVSI